mgnify:CR=1 FL=1
MSKDRKKEKKKLDKSKDSELSNSHKIELPESCKFHLLKGSVIEKLKKKYFLMAHPCPMIEGEMILF